MQKRSVKKSLTYNVIDFFMKHPYVSLTSTFVSLVGAYNCLPGQANSQFQEWLASNRIAHFSSDEEKVESCDTLAGDADDINRVRSKFSGAAKLDFAKPALAICSAAIKVSTEPRLQYQRGRAFESEGLLEEAKEDYRSAALRGYAPAQSRLGQILMREQPNKPCPGLSLLSSAKSGSVSAKYWIGVAMYQGVYEDDCGIKQDKKEGTNLILEAAKLGYSKAIESSIYIDSLFH